MSSRQRLEGSVRGTDNRAQYTHGSERLPGGNSSTPLVIRSEQGCRNQRKAALKRETPGTVTTVRLNRD